MHWPTFLKKLSHSSFDITSDKFLSSFDVGSDDVIKGITTITTITKFYY